MKQKGCGISLRGFLIAFLILCFILTVARQCIDFLGYQWIPIMINFLHILSLIFVVFGVIQLRPGFLLCFLVWVPLWLGWNVFLLCYFLNAGILDRNSGLLSFFTGAENWWIGKTGCSLVYNSTLRRRVIDKCAVEFWHVELAETAVHLLIAAIAAVSVLIFLLNFSNNKLLRSATKTTIRVPHQPRITMEPLEPGQSLVKGPIPPGYHTDTTGYLNASIDESTVNGVTYAAVRNGGGPNGYLPPEGSLERTQLQLNGNALGNDFSVPNYRRGRESESRKRSAQASSKRSSNSTAESPLANADLLPPGARVGPIYRPPPVRSTSQESIEADQAEPQRRRYQRGTSLDRDKRRGNRQKDRRNSFPHRRRAPASRSSDVGPAGAHIQGQDSHRLSSISAPAWQPYQGPRPLSRDQNLSSSQQSLASSTAVGSHRGFKHIPTAGLARMAQAGNDATEQLYSLRQHDPRSSAVKYDPTYDHTPSRVPHRPAPPRPSSPLRTTIPAGPSYRPADPGYHEGEHEPVTSFLTFDPESNTLIRYHDRNSGSQRASLGEMDVATETFQHRHFPHEDDAIIPIRFPPPTPIVQEQSRPPIPPLAPRVLQSKQKRGSPVPQRRNNVPEQTAPIEQPDFDSSSLLV